MTSTKSQHQHQQQQQQQQQQPKDNKLKQNEHLLRPTVEGRDNHY